MSSDGSSRTETVVSVTCSDAIRWIVMERRRFAFWFAFSTASSSIERMRPVASRRVSFSSSRTNPFFASSAVRPAICSSFWRWRRRAPRRPSWPRPRSPRPASRACRGSFRGFRSPARASRRFQLLVEGLLLLRSASRCRQLRAAPGVSCSIALARLEDALLGGRARPLRRSLGLPDLRLGRHLAASTVFFASSRASVLRPTRRSRLEDPDEKGDQPGAATPSRIPTMISMVTGVSPSLHARRGAARVENLDENPVSLPSGGSGGSRNPWKIKAPASAVWRCRLNPVHAGRSLRGSPLVPRGASQGGPLLRRHIGHIGSRT